jgi:hypothetical protein
MSRTEGDAAMSNKIAVYYGGYAGASELVFMDPIDFAAARNKEPANWSTTPFTGRTQITGVILNGQKTNFAIQQADGNYYVMPQTGVPSGFLPGYAVHMNPDGSWSAADLNPPTPVDLYHPSVLPRHVGATAPTPHVILAPKS